MQGMAGDRIGLTDGISSRYLRANRSELLPSLARLRQTHFERNVALHGRLEELLCFEIMKDGATDYKRFTVRTLHKYVLNAIQTKNPCESPKADLPTEKTSQNLLNRLALGRAIVNGGSDEDCEGGTDTQETRAPPNTTGCISLEAIDEKEPFEEPPPTPMAPTDKDAAPVTYRERLGGFLHPRDMRKLVTPFSASNEPELIVRRHAMLLNFDPLRAIVLRDRLIVLVPDGADSILVELEKRVLGNSDNGSDGMNNIMANSESNTSLDEMANTSSHSVGNFAVNIDIPLDKIREEIAFNKDSDKILASERKSEADTTDNLSDSRRESLASQSPAFAMDLDEDGYITAFADNEWEELEAKDWIDLPFELQSVDAVLHCVSAILADDVLDLQLGANSVISELLQPGADVGDRAQDVLRTMKNSIKEMTSRVNGFCRALDCLLEDYEDMALMNLSRLLTHPDRFIQPVSQAVLDEESDEPELIVEAHLQRGHTLKNGLTLVQGQINTTEDFAIRKSDTIRNRLLYINMVISILSLSVTMGSFIGSLFGMNVINGYEDSQSAFRIITFSTIGGSIFFIGLTLFAIKRLGALPNLF